MVIGPLPLTYTALSGQRGQGEVSLFELLPGWGRTAPFCSISIFRDRTLIILPRQLAPGDGCWGLRSEGAVQISGGRDDMYIIYDYEM